MMKFMIIDQSSQEQPEAARGREPLHAEGHGFVLPDGAFVFVKPQSFRDVRTTLVSLHLRPFHLIVSKESRHLLEDMYQTIPSRRRPRMKAKGTHVLDISGADEVEERHRSASRSGAPSSAKSASSARHKQLPNLQQKP